MTGGGALNEPCLVLDVDPDLGAGIGAEDFELARSMCRATMRRVSAGVWDVPDPEGDHVLGFVIVAGLVCREVGLRDAYMFELLGPGDVVQAPVRADRPRLGGEIVLTAAVETTLLELGEPFVRAAARWPSLLAAVHERLEAQRENLAIQGVIAHLALAEHRLLLQLWHLAGRWGRVTAEGTVLPLPLTHELLGHVTAARRSTVTLAVSSLQAQGFVRQIDDRGWLLTPAAEHRVAAITRMRNTERVLGEMFRLRLRPVDLRDESRALMAQARQIQPQARTVGGH